MADGLEVTLFASEPMMTNPTDIDIDAQGRVWVCDVQNYRGHNGLRPAGDRILILEDTKGDGKADKATTFYQGRDVDAALGVCVLGNRVIVSCTPNVFEFTNDGHDNAAKKEVLFKNPGQAQHDHGAHAFVFGPDGKLYWNFGNAGQRVHDKNDKPIVDLEATRSTIAASRIARGWSFAAIRTAASSRCWPTTSATTTKWRSIASARSGNPTTTTTAIAACGSTTSWSTATSATPTK